VPFGPKIYLHACIIESTKLTKPPTPPLGF